MIGTERLILRAWRQADVAPFNIICADLDVMRWLGPVQDVAATQATIERMQDMQTRLGYCFWAIERREDARVIGWCGLIRSTTGPIDGLAEVGWRLARDCWGMGYATEAAQASIGWGFANLADDALWAITTTENRASRKVMGRCGMRYCPELNFGHPRLAADDPLSAHVTYRIDRSQ